MSDEYRLVFAHPGVRSVAECLRPLAGASVLSGPILTLEFRSGSPLEMPDAILRPEGEGAYFCIFGGGGRAFLGQILARLVSSYGSVTVDDWE